MSIVSQNPTKNILFQNRFSLLATPSRGSASDAAALTSLRRENEDLRLKLSRSENALASHRETSIRESSDGHQLRQLCEQGRTCRHFPFCGIVHWIKIHFLISFI